MKKGNAVLEGGGVKGIGHVGAISYFQKEGYLFENVAGSSAGAIVASLVAAGYTAEEMQEIMFDVDYLKFAQEDLLDYLGGVGKVLSVVVDFGIYSSAYLERWLNDLLEAKHCTCFKDVKNDDGTYRLQVTTSDLSEQELLILPQDLAKFNIDIDSFPIARAVRMSMSIPIFYEPYKLKDANGKIHYMVDGGLLANYPIFLLDDGSYAPSVPTFGFRFTSNNEACKKDKQDCINIVDYAKLIVSTLLDGNENYHISKSKGDADRTTFISSFISVDGEKKKISTTDFEITKSESKSLYNNGWYAAKDFLKTWDFEKWKTTYRKIM